jgi:hypothetical protein
MTSIKMTGALYAEMLGDLARPHPFAGERVGFVLGRYGSLGNSSFLVLLHRYYSIPNHQYIADHAVGARIGKEAITWGMQAAYRGRPMREGVFHVHLHAHKGKTDMSGVDRRETPEVVRGFRTVGADAIHGILILSLDHAAGWVWLPGSNELAVAASVCVIGHPIQIFEKGAGR